jgi:hypothetical protein
MLAKFTLVAESSKPQIGGIGYTLTAEDSYLFNTNRIRAVRAYNTTDSEFDYVFEPDSRQASCAIFRATANVEDYAVQFDLTPTTNLPSFTVLTDYDGETLDSARTEYFPMADIILADEYDTDKTALYISWGGVTVRKYVVQENLDEILAKV